MLYYSDARIFVWFFLVWIQGQEHQEEEGQHCGFCGWRQGDAEEETEGKSQATNSKISNDYFLLNQVTSESAKHWKTS